MKFKLNYFILEFISSFLKPSVFIRGIDGIPGIGILEAICSCIG
jgi:hypothetical protein